MSKEKDSHCFDCSEEVNIEDMYDAIQCEDCHDNQVEKENEEWSTGNY